VKIKSKYLYISLIVLSCNYLGYAQDAGNILSRGEANIKFGPVIHSYNIDNTLLDSLNTEAGNYIMFNFIDGNFIILGNNKTPLYPKNYTISAGGKYKVYSTSKVRELIREGNENTTTLEYRGDVITLTNGDYTLTGARTCPPFCQ
jgi:hypothetical protein